jgi:chromate reductase
MLISRRRAGALLEAIRLLLFVSPEYTPIPGALKNAIDWGSRPWGTNSFARKPTGMIGAPPASMSKAVMQSFTRTVLSFLDAPGLSAPEAYVKFGAGAFGDNGEVRTNPQPPFLRHYMDEDGAFAQRVLAKALRHIGGPGAGRPNALRLTSSGQAPTGNGSSRGMGAA